MLDQDKGSSLTLPASPRTHPVPYAPPGAPRRVREPLARLAPPRLGRLGALGRAREQAVLLGERALQRGDLYLQGVHLEAKAVELAGGRLERVLGGAGRDWLTCCLCGGEAEA